jgi:spermidine synthase
MTAAQQTRQIVEPLAPGLTRVWELDRVIYEGDTKYQHVVIADTEQGVSLFCDNDRQSTEFSQLVYHEALMVPALLLADQIRNVLVVGSSEGVVCQMAVAAGATRLDHVDIDEQAVKLCAEHLPYGYTPAELAAAECGEGAITVRYTDGWQFLLDAASSDVRYDIVLIDLPDERADEAAQHNRLYGAEFLDMCKAVLAPGGVVVNQSGCQTLWRNATLKTSWRRFTESFGTVAYYGSDEHEWAYLFGRVETVADPTALMLTRLPTLPYRPLSIDPPALRSNAIPPYSVRHQ